MANTITLSRFPLLAIYIALLYWGSGLGQLVAVGLIFVIILLDVVDGQVARRRNEANLFGSMLDIAVDRAVEIVLWVVFAHIGLISIVLPLLVIVRGIMTDAIRGVGMSDGTTPFDQIQSEWGRWLVSHRLMRAVSGTSKTVAFCLLTLTVALITLNHSLAPLVQGLAVGASIIAVAVCLLRGAPVLIEAYWAQTRIPVKDTFA